MIATFDTQTFSTELERIAQRLRPVPSITHNTYLGEHVYCLIGVLEQVNLVVRSSISVGSGLSAESGDDSIRVWISYNLPKNGVPSSVKITRWTTRIEGWPIRLEKVIKSLIELQCEAGRCAKCNLPMFVWRVRKPGPNHGRLFAKCAQCSQGFKWLNEHK